MELIFIDLCRRRAYRSAGVQQQLSGHADHDGRGQTGQNGRLAEDDGGKGRGDGGR